MQPGGYNQVSMNPAALVGLLTLYCFLVPLSLVMAEEHRAHVADEDASEQIHAVIESLPTCSWLRQTLEQGQRGTGREQRYSSTTTPTIPIVFPLLLIVDMDQIPRRFWLILQLTP